MDKNTYIGLGAVVLVLIVGFLIAQNSGDRDTRDNDRDDDTEEVATTTDDESSDTSGGANAPVSGVASDTSGERRGVVAGLDPMDQSRTSTDSRDETSAATVATVRYTNSGFEPRTVRIARGGTVTFVNASDARMQLDSETYDAFGQDSAGDRYVFPFLQSGTWTYENRLETEHTGTIIVE